MPTQDTNQEDYAGRIRAYIEANREELGDEDADNRLKDLEFLGRHLTRSGVDSIMASLEFHVTQSKKIRAMMGE